MEKTNKKPFNKRAFISICMFTSGIILPFSGFMNHLNQYESLTINRHFWMSVHNMAAILFTIFTIIHIFSNWRSIVRYFQNLRGEGLSREALLAIVFVLLIVGIFSCHSIILG